MRRAIALTALYAAALALGIGSAWFWLTRVGVAGVDAGIWRVNLLAGSTAADPYTRARIAIGAVLALDRSETLYYTTSRDDNGAALRAECNYRIEGPAPRARWWSITAYGGDNFLMPNPQGRYSVGSERAVIDQRGHFTAALGPAAPDDDRAGAWIPTSGRGGLRLTLRLYGPSTALQGAPGSLSAPSVRLQGSCP
jgi:hypothetical protein